ncbi:MAG: SIMPL domain-containing protein, partial [Alphaproteobacteria bacterium]|nr:SIMPL domain-containing protein [Alphaproteobacteria bacterium]
MKKSFLYLGCTLVISVLTVLMFCIFESEKTSRTISVNGECLTTAPRDKTAITLRVSVLDDSAAESMRVATTQMSEITNYLKTLPVEMQTTQFNSYEKTEWNREAQKNEILGIETTVAVEVSASSIDTIETVLSHFAGQSNVFTENLRMYSSPETLKPIMDRCMAVAVQDARTRASVLASADNMRAGRMLSVSYV